MKEWEKYIILKGIDIFSNYNQFKYQKVFIILHAVTKLECRNIIIL